MIAPNFEPVQINGLWIYPIKEEIRYRFGKEVVPKGTIYIKDVVDEYTLEGMKEYISELQEAVDYVEKWAEENGVE